MVKSDVFLMIRKAEIPNVLDAVEQFGEMGGLENIDAMKLRLLAEEMFSVTERMLIKYNSEFWVESQNRAFELHLNEWASIDKDQKDMLLSVSKDGQNKLNKGLFGKIGAMVENMLNGSLETSDMSYSLNFYRPGMVRVSGADVWSMRTYEKTLTTEARKQDFYGLEKSILAHLADDITVGVKKDKVEVVVKVAF